MPDSHRLKAVKNQTEEDDKIKVVLSDGELKDKIKIHMEEDEGDAIYWYITFNIPLDTDTLTEETVSVTDTEGYIKDSSIRYDFNEKRIVIRPAERYENNKYYLLNIKKDVRSMKGKPLKHNIHILFKLIDNKISEFQVLKNTVKVPTPRRRPDTRDEKTKGITKYYSFLKDDKFLDLEEGELPFETFNFPIWLFLLSILAISIGFFIPTETLQMIIMFIGLIIGGLAMSQILKKENRSILYYNFGVMFFNKSKYKRATKFFNRAYFSDMTNEMAEYARSKSKFYEKN